MGLNRSKLKATELAFVDTNNIEYIVHDFERQGLVARTKDQLKSALSKLGSNNGTICIVDIIDIDEDLTIPENISLKFFNGGILNVLTQDIPDEDVGTGDGSTTEFSLAYSPVLENSETIYVDGTEQTRNTDYTINYETGVITFTSSPTNGASITADYTRRFKLTINGGIDAGLFQIFSGDGVVTGNPKIEAVYPEWFGAKGDGVTDNYDSIRKCLDSFGRCKLSEGVYRTSKPIEIYSYQVLEGSGYSSVLKNDNDDDADAECILVGNMVGDPSAFVESRTDMIAATNTTGVSVGDFDIVVDDVSQFKEGDLVWLRSDRGYTTSGGKFIPEYQQISKIVKIDLENNTITLEDPIYKTFTETIYVCKNSETSRYFLSERAIVKNIKFEAISDTWYRLGGAYKCIFENIFFDVNGSGIVFNGAAYSTFKTIKGVARRNCVDLGHFSHHSVFEDIDVVVNTTSPTVSVVGIYEGSHHNKFKNCKFKSSDFTGYYGIIVGVADVIFDKCVFEFNGTTRTINTIDLNEFGYHCTIEKCQISDKITNYLISSNNSRLHISDSYLYVNTVNYNAYIIESGGSIVSSGNTIHIQNGNAGFQSFQNSSKLFPTIIEDMFVDLFPPRDNILSAKKYGRIRITRNKCPIDSLVYARGSSYTGYAKIINTTVPANTLTSTEQIVIWCYGSLNGSNDYKTVAIEIGTTTYTYNIPNTATKFRIKAFYGSTNYTNNYQRLCVETWDDINGLDISIVQGNDDISADMDLIVSVDVANANDSITPTIYGVKLVS